MKESRKPYCTAIVLAGGKGSRMGSATHKQYLPLCGKPVLAYSLLAFEKSDLIDQIVLVCGEGEEEYCREEILERYNISKAVAITTGGKERFYSVWNGICAISENPVTDYVFIHDGARPFVDQCIIRRAYEEVQLSGACVVGMPVKDTIKQVDPDRNVVDTPKRSSLWLVQTPQVFSYELIRKAYAELIEQGITDVTDDAMVAERMLSANVRMVEGSYLNIKITTPEDLKTGEIYASMLAGEQ